MEPTRTRFFRRMTRMCVRAALLLLMPTASSAASVCYDPTLLPSVIRLAATPEAVRAWIGDRRQRFGDGRMVTLLLGAEGWEQGPAETCGEPGACQPAEEQGCAEHVPAIELSLAELRRLRPDLDAEFDYHPDQRVTACVREGDVVWFGIGFYAGEGLSGAGGLGRLDTKTGAMEVRRPLALRTASVSHLAKVGSRLWVGSTRNHECIGGVPAAGLFAYDWERQTETPAPGACGMAVYGLVADRGVLWVASDLGLSRVAAAGDFRDVQHFLPDGTRPPRPVTCAALYAELLDTLPDTDDLARNAYMFRSVREMFLESLARLHPEAVYGALRDAEKRRARRNLE